MKPLKIVDIFFPMAIGVVLGTYIGMRVADNFITSRVPQEILIERKVEEYKKAEAICGADNVTEHKFCEKEDGCSTESELTGSELTCQDFSWAAMDEASRSAIEQQRLQKKVDDYCENKKVFGGNFYLY
jgi:hypothetical protein